MVLDNKLGLTCSSDLARAEEKISKRKALDLFETGILDGLEVGRFASLAFIHHYLFDEIYDFAGKIRTVDMAKGHFRFASVIYLSLALDQIDQMPQTTFEEIIDKYVEMNLAHPFREGNGRSMRIWLDIILKKELGLVVDWSKIDKMDYLLAMERSPVKSLELKYLLQNALTNQINDREVYLKGIDTSYAYEGYDTYQMSDL